MTDETEEASPGRNSLEALAEEIVEAVYANEDSYTAVLKILQREARRPSGACSFVQSGNSAQPFNGHGSRALRMRSLYTAVVRPEIS